MSQNSSPKCPTYHSLELCWSHCNIMLSHMKASGCGYNHLFSNAINRYPWLRNDSIDCLVERQGLMYPGILTQRRTPNFFSSTTQYTWISQYLLPEECLGLLKFMPDSIKQSSLTLFNPSTTSFPLNMEKLPCLTFHCHFTISHFNDI